MEKFNLCNTSNDNLSELENRWNSSKITIMITSTVPKFLIDTTGAC